MTDQPKKTHGSINVIGFQQLIRSNQAINDRNHRPFIQPTLPQEKKQFNRNNSQKENEKSTPKPLLECLEPGPLLLSKPFEKSISNRRKKNKPFDDENLGRIILSI